jgi:hypothetical protein
MSWEDDLQMERTLFSERYLVERSEIEPSHSEESATKREEEEKGVDPDGCH